MKRFMFSIYDSVAKTFSEPFFIMNNDKDVACTVAMRSIGNQDMSKSVVPISDLKLYYLAEIDEVGAVIPADPDDWVPEFLCEISDLQKVNDDG